MLHRLVIAFFVFFSLQASAMAGVFQLEHKTVKNLVRLSLWYEGAGEFNKSSFHPSAAERLAREARNASEAEAPAMTEELAVALENLNS